MNKGSRFFVSFTQDGEPEKKKGKGRSPLLIERRNEKLFYRYYYYSRILQMRYENVLKALANEFDLSQVTIVELISGNAGRLKEISDTKITRGQLKSMYPFYSWTEKACVPPPIKPRAVYELKG